MKKVIIALLILIVLGAGGWYLYSTGSGNTTDEETTDNGNIVAVVNGEEVSQDDYNALEAQVVAQQGVDTSTLTEEEEAQLQSQVVDTLVSQTLLSQVVSDSGITVEDADVDEQITAIQGQFETEEEFNQVLSSQGATMEDLREQVRGELSTQAYLEEQLNLSSLSATDEEIQAMYDQSVAGQEGAPALSEVRDQVEQLVLQQKQQQLVNEFVQDLRTDADIEIRL